MGDDGRAESAVHDFIRAVEEHDGGQLLRVKTEVNPADFEVSGVLSALEAQGRHPMVLFERARDLHGGVSPLPVLSGVFASRERCALALGLEPSVAGLPLSLEYANRESSVLEPVRVPQADAPVLEVVETGDGVDLGRLPIIRFHEMDPAPYVDMVSVMKHPDEDVYNAAFLRNMYQGPRQLGLHMSPRHNWQFARTNERDDRPTPVAIVVSHHPGFYLGSLNVRPYGDDDYHVIGSVMGEPLRLTPSVTLGEDFLIPADADLVIEGQVLPHEREIEGPFGEFPGYYGPQRRNWVVSVNAVLRRRHAVYQGVFVGHKDNWTLGSIPKEGALYRRIRGVVPGVKAVHLPESGCGRFHCYISLDKRVGGESRQAALIALGEIDFVKHVVVVDDDIDVFSEQQVWWAVATRVQAGRSLDIIHDSKGNTLDPSLLDDILSDKLIIDATKPVGRPFAERVTVPDRALRRAEELLSSIGVLGG